MIGNTYPLARLEPVFSFYKWGPGKGSDEGMKTYLEQEEIEMMRVVTRRLLKMARGCKDIGELITVLNTLGMASTRLAGLMRTQKFLGGNRDRFDEFVDRAIEEVLEEKGWMEKRNKSV